MFVATQPELPVRDEKLAVLYLKYIGFKLINGAWLKGQHHGAWLKGQHHGAEIRKTPKGACKIVIGKHV